MRLGTRALVSAATAAIPVAISLSSCAAAGSGSTPSPTGAQKSAAPPTALQPTAAETATAAQRARAYEGAISLVSDYLAMWHEQDRARQQSPSRQATVLYFERSTSEASLTY
jgi:hypothetical protein